MKKILCLFFITVIVFSFTNCSQVELLDKRSNDFWAMDTYCNITVYGSEENLDDLEPLSNISADISSWSDHLLSDTDSGKSIFASSDGEQVILKDEIIQTMELSLQLSKITNGKFDLTVAPLSKLWNISKASEPPPDEEIKDILQLVGYEKLSLESNILTFQKAGMGIDIGAVGKGLTAKKTEDILKEFGYQNAVINLGGNVTVFGDKQGQGFNIGIQSPFSSEVLGVINVSNTSVVTSGTYERKFEYDGITYHHLLDTTTGYPSNTGIASVTVICKNHMLADAFSTAIFLSGTEEGTTLFNFFYNLSSSTEPSSEFSLYGNDIGLTGAIIVTEEKKIIVLGNVDFSLKDNNFSLASE